MNRYYDRFLSARARRNGINWEASPSVPRNLSRLDKEAEQFLQQSRREERLARDLPVIDGDAFQRQEMNYVPQQRRWLPTAGWICLSGAALIVAYALGSAAVVGDWRDVFLSVGLLAAILGMAFLHRE